jgi:hypothetical protein
MARNENPFENIVQRGAERLFLISQNLPEPFPPLGYRKLTRAEQLARYRDMVNDPAAWRELIRRQGLEATIQYAKTMKVLSEAEEVQGGADVL